jgi:HlyD family secretion protein
MPKIMFSLIKNKKFLSIGMVVVGLILVKILFLKTPDNTLTYTIKREALIDTVQVSGTYTIAATTSVLSPAKGIITKLHVKNGDDIKKDEPLFYVESTATTEEKTSAYADYQTAINNLKVAEQNKISAQSQLEQDRKAIIDASNSDRTMQDNRNEGKLNPSTNKAYTQGDIDSIQSALTSARYTFSKDEKKYNEADIAINAARASLTKMQLAYSATQNITVKSPTSGTIANLQKNLGDQTSANAAPVLVVADYRNPTIEVSINEAYVPRIRLGQKAHIVFDALKTQIFDGVLTNIDSIGSNESGSVTYKAKLEITNLSEIIKPNMTALITIETLRKNNVLTVPNSAVSMKDNKYYVYEKINPAKYKLIEVALGERGVTKSEVKSGVAAGAIIRATANTQ